MADTKHEIRSIARYFRVENVKVNINSETKAPVLHDNGSTLNGLSTILQYLAQRDTSQQECRSQEDKASIRQWLEYRVTEVDRCDNEKDVYLVLKELNGYLSNNTYFVGNSLTIADLCIYHGLHSIMIQCQPQYKSNLPSIPFQSQSLYPAV